jgi:hypothetical protein
MLTDDKRIACPTLLPSADELYNFNLRAWLQNRLGPTGLLDNTAIQFNSHARRVKLQLVQQAEDSLPLRGCLGFAVDYDVDGHSSWLTPFLVPIIV